MTDLHPKTAPNGLRDLLRGWRDLRGKSQLDLSLDTGISQRHLSFVETGRSVPSRETLLQVAAALDVPLRERNALLLAAGYAPVYPEPAWDAPEMASIVAALRRMLRQHEPFPAIVMDRYWDVVLTNEAAPRFFGRFVDLSARPAPRNMLHLMFDPDGMRPFVANWEGVARSLLARVRREAIGRVLDSRTKALVAALLAYPGAGCARNAATPANMPVIPLSFVKDGDTLNYFSMVTTVGDPQAVLAQELRVECLFPADDETERLHVTLMAESAQMPAAG
ncbi:MAG: helix-turn-helix domain-containing protein [Janthinobacterium lividum]